MSDELLKEAISCTALQDVYLSGCTSELFNDFDPKISGQGVTIQHKIGADKFRFIDGQINEKPAKMLRVYVSTGTRYIGDNLNDKKKEDEEAEVENHICAEITATFVAEYRLTCDELSKEAAEEFAVRNASFHVWPYWRELLHSMAGRMHLPEVVLPMFQLPSGGEKEGQDEKREASE